MMIWFVDGELAAENGFQAPRDPAGVILNMWSNGGTWTGNMTVYDEAFLQIQWVEMVFNTSVSISGRLNEEKAKEERCETVCSVDENVTVIGSPAILWSNAGILKPMGMAELSWMSVLLASSVLFGWL